MIILDRKKSPSFKTIESIDIIKASEEKLKNDVPLYIVNAGEQDLIKIEFIFPAGKWHESFPMVASTTNSMLDEGTTKHTAEEIAENIDSYGAFLEADIDKDFASVSLYSLNKHLKSTLPIVEDLIKLSIFPQNELNTYLQNKKQRFLVNSKKVNYIARRAFSELIFGKEHPYGNNSSLEDFDTLKRDDLINFYNNFYKSDNCKIVVSGKVKDDTINLINEHFGGNEWSLGNNNNILKKEAIITSHPQKKHLIYREDAIQSAIRVGRVLFSKNHPDYMGMKVLNTVLGGYFGSRLMNNLREDKGFTYGVGSGVVPMKNAGCFFVSTEVGVDVCKQAVDEIYVELKRLREELIKDEELDLVKNYLMGVFLKSIDTPFALADKFIEVLEFGFGYEYYDKYFHTIKTITPHDLRELAIKYFQEEDMTELVVGKK